MTDSSPDELPDLPDLGDPDEAPEVTLQRLAERNRERLGQLAQRGAMLSDSHPLVTAFIQNELLEAVLRRVTDKTDADDVLLSAQLRLAELLDQSEAGVNRAILQSPPLDGQLPSRRFRRGG